MSSEDQEASEAIEALGRGALRRAPERAFELFEQAWPLLERRIAGFLRSFRLRKDLNEDCGQNTLLKVWRARETYRGTTFDEFYAWLYRITRHEAQRLSMQAGRQPLREVDAGDEVTIDSLGAATAEDSTSREVDAEDQARALDECIGHLDERARELVELLYGPDAASERAAAMMLEISKSYVNTLRQEALAALARCLRRKGLEA